MRNEDISRGMKRYQKEKVMKKCSRKEGVEWRIKGQHMKVQTLMLFQVMKPL